MKKVLSFVLTMALVLTSFSMAFADTKPEDKGTKPAETTAKGLSDIDKSANKEAISVCYDLGIVTGTDKGTFEPAKAVTRAEFAAMITRSLGIPESALKATATKFKDTKGYGWAVPYLAFCNSKGIMLGDGRGNAMPGKTISLNEAVTMSLRAIGYTTNSSELVGAWPANYVTKGQEKGLYEKVPGNLEGLDKQICAQVVYNLLTVPKVSVDKEGRTTELWNHDKKGDRTSAITLLSTGLGCTVGDETTLIGNEDSKVNLTSYKGARVIPYYNKDKKIIAIGEVKSEFLKGEITVANNEIKVGDVKYTIKGGYNAADPKLLKFLNGVQGVVANLEKDKTYTLAVEKDGKTIKQIYSVAAWNTANKRVAPKSVQNQIKSKSLSGVNFALDSDKNIDTKSFELLGVASLDKIAEGNVLYVYDAVVDGKTVITKVEVGTEVVKGQVTKIAGDKYTIDGKEYEKAKAITAKLGDKVEAKLDIDGKIFETEAISTDSHFGVIRGAIVNGLGGQAKLYTTDKTEKVLNISMKEADWRAVFAADADATNVLTKYDLDKNGAVSKVVKAEKPASLTIKNSRYVEVGGNGIPISDKAVLFTAVVNAGNVEKYTLANVKDLPSNKTLGAADLPFAQYVLEDGVITALVVPSTIGVGTSAKVTAVVNATADVFVDGNKALQITGLSEGAAYTGNITAASPVVDLTNIKLYELSIDANKNIVGFAEVASDGGEQTVAEDVTNDSLVKIGVTYKALSSKANIYVAEKNSDGKYEYKLSYAGAILKDAKIYLYETNNEKGHEGYDVVIIKKN